MSLTSVGALRFLLCDSASDRPLLQLAIPEQARTDTSAAAAEAMSLPAELTLLQRSGGGGNSEEEGGRLRGGDVSVDGVAPPPLPSLHVGSPAFGAVGSRSTGSGGGRSPLSGEGGLTVTCGPVPLRALVRAAGGRTPSASAPPSPFVGVSEPFNVRVRLQLPPGGGGSQRGSPVARSFGLAPPPALLLAATGPGALLGEL